MNEKVRESIKEGKKFIAHLVYYLSKFYRQRFSERKTLMSLGAVKDEVYNSYLKVQLKKTVMKLNKDASFRYKIIIEEILKNINIEKRDVLCVGCRNSFELDAFERAGFGEVKGIDIQSTDPRILVMDMGKMTFESDSFNVLYSGDSLEHAYNVGQAVSEFCRVVKSGGYIAIVTPINYMVNDMDRWDFKSVENLRREFEKNVKSATVIWRETTADCMKVIFRIVK